MEHRLVTYIRTKHVYETRLKDVSNETVKINKYELVKLGCKGETIYRLREMGLIWYDENGRFKVLVEGPLDPDLLTLMKKRKLPPAVLEPIHEYMREQLLKVNTKSQREELPVYFKAFLDYREFHLETFFTVDSFSGRVHTPIVSLKTKLRGELTLAGDTTVSLDVKQMQPVILGRVLEDVLGSNPFSEAINEGRDVYVMLQTTARLETREEAKKMLYRLIFGHPREELAETFSGDNSWVKWINTYKSHPEVRNPHTSEPHTNLAWLLQYSEVQVMKEIWKRLQYHSIPFLTIHDDIICRPCDKELVLKEMKNELKQHFKRFEVVAG